MRTTNLKLILSHSLGLHDYCPPKLKGTTEQLEPLFRTLGHKEVEGKLLGTQSKRHLLGTRFPKSKIVVDCSQRSELCFHQEDDILAK